jgi:AraC-like DNA-binding protein
VPAGEVHRPVIHGQTPYHRLILYISPDFFEHYRQQGIDLDYCFASCSRRGTHVLRIPRLTDTPLYAPLQELMQSGRPQNAPSSASAARPLALPNNRLPFGSEHEHNLYQTAGNATAQLYQTSVLLQFLILLADFCDGRATDFPAASGSNPQILQILSFINEHLYEELPIDRIASACFLNRSYLMHLFRKEMGCTLGSYITEKRLFTAQTLIRSGTPITEACLQSGFSGYSSFYRAYRRKFGTPPSQL